MIMKKTALTGIVLGIASFFVAATPALAHVVVKPAQVGIGSFQTFTMGVPNEKETATVEVRLMIPKGLNYVSPTVKPGWNIEIKKQGSGDNAQVTEIDWTGGTIPVGQRDDFSFSAQVPASETTLAWDAYQVYENGETVAWTQKPGTMDESGTPHSLTKVINDLAPSPMPSANSTETTTKIPLLFSIVALALSALSLGFSFRNKK
jgi:uncharacterized protein YcnI